MLTTKSYKFILCRVVMAAVRLVTNLIAYLHGYEVVQIYHREGDACSEYIWALKKTDNHYYQPLQNIIKQRLRRL